MSAMRVGWDEATLVRNGRRTLQQAHELIDAQSSIANDGPQSARLHIAAVHWNHDALRGSMDERSTTWLPF
jgi:hypothetical protein